MKNIKSYKIFEKSNCDKPTHVDELIDTFSQVIHNPEVVAIPYTERAGDDFHLYVMYGENNLNDDREFLRELYGLHDVIRKLYNKDYYYIDIRGSIAIIIFIDYQNTFFKNDIFALSMSLLRNKIPDNIYRIIDKSACDIWWKYGRTIGDGITFKGGSSNMSLFPWIYEPKEDPIYPYKKDLDE